MSSFVESIDAEIKEFLKNGNKSLLAIARIVKTDAIKYAKDNGCSESEIDAVKILKSNKKKLTEEIETLKQAGRDFTQQQEQLSWVESKLPQELTEDEVRSFLSEFVVGKENLNMGMLMGQLKQKFLDRFDGKIASKVVKEFL